jgi:hypothetical protein
VDPDFVTEMLGTSSEILHDRVVMSWVENLHAKAGTMDEIGRNTNDVTDSVVLQCTAKRAIATRCRKGAVGSPCMGTPDAVATHEREMTMYKPSGTTSRTPAFRVFNATHRQRRAVMVPSSPPASDHGSLIIQLRYPTALTYHPYQVTKIHMSPW